MKKLLSLIAVVFLGLPLLAGAVQITVPSAPSDYYFLVSTTTGQYIASSSPLFRGGINFTNGTGTSATTTNFFSTNASTSNLFGTNITGFGLTSCNGATSALTFSGTLFGCHTISAGSASTTLLTDNNGFSGLNTFTDLKLVTRSTTTNATTTGTLFVGASGASNNALLSVDGGGNTPFSVFAEGIEGTPFFGVDNLGRAFFNGDSIATSPLSAEVTIQHRFTTRFDPLLGTGLPANYPLYFQNTSSITGSSTGIGFGVTSANGSTGAGIVFTRTGSNSQGKLDFLTHTNATAGAALTDVLTLTDSGLASTTNFLANGSSTLQNFTAVNATTSQATTTNLAVSSLTSGKCVQAGTGGLLTTTGAACGSGGSTSPGGSTNQLQFNNSGSFGGASELIYDQTVPEFSIGSTTSSGMLVNINTNTNLATLTVHGNVAVSSTLSAAGLTSTAQSQLTNINSTAGNYFISDASDSYVQNNAGNFGIGTNAPNFKLEVNGTASTTKLFATSATTTQATTTNFAISNIASGNCLQTSTGGAIIGSGSACGSSSGGAAYPFQGAGNSTSTLVGFNAGLISSASSTFTSSLRVSSSSPGSDLFNVGTGGTTYLSVDSGGTLNGYQQIQFNGPTFAQFQDTTAGASMDFKTVAGTGDITFTPNNTRQLTLSNNGNSTFVNLVQAANFLATGSSTLQNFTGLKSTTTNATTSSLAITSLGTPAGTFLAVNPQGSVIATTSPVGGSGVTSITAGTGLTGGTITTTGTIALDLTAQNIFTGASTTFVGGVTLGTATATSATTTNLAISSVASKLLVTNGNGTVSGYGGASACSSNNFVTALSALGATTCGTSTISGVSLGGTLGALTATDSTLTFSGSYTGATARTVGLNLANANTWTALQTFSNANSLLASGSSTLQAFTFTNATGSAYQLTGTNNVPVLGIYSPAVNQMAFSTASTFRGLFDANGRFALGTSTPTFDLTVASTSPTLELNDTDGATNNKHLIMSYNSGIFAIGTSSDSILTSTSTSLTLNPLGPAALSVGTTSTAAILNVGDNPNESGTASSTMSTSGKFQIDTYNNAGARVCVEINSSNAFVAVAGACTN